MFQDLTSGFHLFSFNGSPTFVSYESDAHAVVRLNMPHPLSIILSCTPAINSEFLSYVYTRSTDGYPTLSKGGNLEPVMCSRFAYDLPHITRHAIEERLEGHRSMCGQRKYLAGKRRAASGEKRDCLVTRAFPFLLLSCHSNVDAQIYILQQPETYIAVHTRLLNQSIEILENPHS